jgi:DNA-binding MltR family transcriptional regulator
MKTRDIRKLKVGSGEHLAPGYCKVFSENDQNSVLMEIDKESDRSVVLVSASFLDDLLKSRLALVFSKGNKAARDALFDFNGPFGSFSTRIETLFCLGLLDKVSRDDLHVVRKLRNYCAHNWSNFAFGDEVQSKFVSSMKNFLVLPPDGDDHERPFSCRSKFVLVSAYYLLTLNYHAPMPENLLGTHGN